MSPKLRIRERRNELDMSQEELAVLINSSQKQVSKYETGINDPTADVLNLLADALDTTVDYILGRTDYPERPLRGEFDLDEIEREAIKILRSKKRAERERIVEIMKLA
jgi:transcriptional regulator with XRE-family HTH domain